MAIAEYTSPQSDDSFKEAKEIAQLNVEVDANVTPIPDMDVKEDQFSVDINRLKVVAPEPEPPGEVLIGKERYMDENKPSNEESIPKAA